eukprot:4796085-Pleurochrysis_carterae.AAC.1
MASSSEASQLPLVEPVLHNLHQEEQFILSLKAFSNNKYEVSYHLKAVSMAEIQKFGLPSTMAGPFCFLLASLLAFI